MTNLYHLSRSSWPLALALTMWLVCISSSDARKPKIEGWINLNTATLEQLTLLPRIGPKTAARILKYRKRYRFRSTREIRRVKGIGRKTYLRLKPFLSVKKKTEFRVVSRK